MSDHHGNYIQFFLDPEVIFSSHTIFINASTKEFTLVNNVFLSHNGAFEHLLYYKMVANVFPKNMMIFSKNRHIPFQFVNRFLSR